MLIALFGSRYCYFTCSILRTIVEYSLNCKCGVVIVIGKFYYEQLLCLRVHVCVCVCVCVCVNVCAGILQCMIRLAIASNSLPIASVPAVEYECGRNFKRQGDLSPHHHFVATYFHFPHY